MLKLKKKSATVYSYIEKLNTKKEGLIEDTDIQHKTEKKQIKYILQSVHVTNCQK
jgi:hypothetical protein